MSRMNAQPLEVPFRFVEHDFGVDYAEGYELITGVGKAEHDEEWPKASAGEIAAFKKEWERRLAARKRLGGFGFGRHL